MFENNLWNYNREIVSSFFQAEGGRTWWGRSVPIPNVGLQAKKRLTLVPATSAASVTIARLLDFTWDIAMQESLIWARHSSLTSLASVPSDAPKSVSGSLCFLWYGFTMGSFRLSQGVRHSICLTGSDKYSPIWATIFKTKQYSLLVPIFGEAPYVRQKARKSPK